MEVALIIKGEWADAQAAARAHGITLDCHEAVEVDGSVAARVDAPGIGPAQLNEWLLESTEVPFPAGSLLLWNGEWDAELHYSEGDSHPHFEGGESVGWEAGAR